MPGFKVLPLCDGIHSFQVVGLDGTPCADVNRYLAHLATCGRSVYTLRAYALGLADFLGWLSGKGITVDDVTHQTIGDYIGAFGRSAKGGAGQTNPKRAGHINAQTRKTYPTRQRKPTTINHRLSVLTAYYTYCIERDQQQGRGPWLDRVNPVAPAVETPGLHGMPGRDQPPRRRSSEFRRRIPKQIPKTLTPELIDRLMEQAASWRDQAILTLLLRTGQRIGDWSEAAGSHGILGMTLADVDEQRRTITVRLKGARDQHRVPVTDDFWPLYRQYLTHERPVDAPTSALWIATRKGRGQPLSYATFESSLRYIGRKIGANVNAHMFRHTLAQGVLDTTGNLKVVQDLLGHAHLSTTIDLYTQTDERALVDAVTAVKTHFDAARDATRLQSVDSLSPTVMSAVRYAFAYAPQTIAVLDQVATQQPPTTEER